MLGNLDSNRACIVSSDSKVGPFLMSIECPISQSRAGPNSREHWLDGSQVIIFVEVIVQTPDVKPIEKGIVLRIGGV